MPRQSNLKLRGSELKNYMLEKQIDPTGRKISVRKFIQTYWKDIGGAYKSTGTYDRWTRCAEIKESEPYKGEVVSQELVYKYGIDNKLIDEDVSYEEFSNDNLKVKGKLLTVKEDKIQNYIENELLGVTIAEPNTIQARRKSCITIMGSEDAFWEFRDEVKEYLKHQQGGIDE